MQGNKANKMNNRGQPLDEYLVIIMIDKVRNESIRRGNRAAPSENKMVDNK